MSSTTTGYRNGGGRGGAKAAGRSAPALPGRGAAGAALARFRAALEAPDGSPAALQGAAEELGRGLGCLVAITDREREGVVAVRAETRPPGFSDAPDRGFLTRVAERLSRQRCALTVQADGAEAVPGLAPDQHYLAIPAPRELGARYALHLFSKTHFSAAERRVARAAADYLGARAPAAGAARAAEEHVDERPGRARAAGAVAIERLLSDAMRAAAETMGADSCSLMVKEQGGELVVDTAYGLDEGVLRDRGVRASKGIAAWVMLSGEPVILGNPRQDPRFEGLDIEPRSDIRSSICVPIAIREGLRGVVSFNRTGRAEPFDDSGLQLARVLAAQLGPSVANARLYQQAAAQLGEMTAAARDNAAAHERLRHDLDDLDRLYDGVQRINAGLEPCSIVEQTAHGVALLVGGRNVGFAAFDGMADSTTGWAQAATPSLALSVAATAAAQSLTRSVLVDERTPTAPSCAAEVAAEIDAQIGDGTMVLIPFADARGSLGLAVGWGFSRLPSDRELALAAGLCAYGATALRKAIDYQAVVSQRSLELSALYQLCGEISAATSFESALRSVLEIARSMVRYDEGLVFICNEESSRLELAACRGVDFDATRAQAPQDQPGNMYQWVLAEGKAFISTDAGQAGHESAHGRQVLRSSMAVPLVVGNETIGVLAIHSALPRAYTEEHVKVLSIVASQAAAIYRALQSLGRLSRYTDKILQSIVAGVIGLDRAGKVVMWSPAAARVFNRDAAEAVGADFLSLAHDIGRDCGGLAGRTVESLGMVARRVLAHGDAVLEHELRLERDGRPPRALLADCTPLRDADGRLVGAVILVEDVTDRKRMQDRMRQMSQLAAVGHLAANVAHEIRNPLSAIKTAAQFLSTEYGSDTLIAQFTGIIDEECDRLSKVATDFLTFARPNDPALERVSLVSVVEGALAATAREMAERNVTVKWRPLRRFPRVWADPEAMRQVFVNLLTNAAQAIGNDGEIHVALHAARLEQGERVVEAVITDSGPGIAEDDVERIWTPFYSTKAKGTGLGLSIVRKTVESHGGQVWAEGPRGKGAAFRVRLPLKRPGRGRAAAATPEPEAGGARPRWRQLNLYDEHPAGAIAAKGLAAIANQGDDE